MEFTESRLKFIFEDTWEVLQFDKTGEYRDAATILDNTKGVDFVAHFENGLYLFEIKNFRGYGQTPANRLKLGNSMEVLLTEVAQKVKDTIALLVGFGRNDSTAHALWLKSLEHLCSQKPVIITAWVEEDSPASVRRKRKKAELAVKTEKLKKKLAWLSPIITIENVKQRSFNFEGLTVESV